MQLGQKLEKINFNIDDGSNVSSDEFLGKKLIIYFYPKDDTPGCTKEAIDFTDHLSQFKKLNTKIIGVSKDSVEKHKKFISKYSLQINLCADEDLKLCKFFKVWVEKSMYGKKYMGIDRSTFLFDENLKLIKLWRKVKVNNHVKEILEFLSS